MRTLAAAAFTLSLAVPVGADFEAAFDGSTHRDELWRSETIE